MVVISLILVFLILYSQIRVHLRYQLASLATTPPYPGPFTCQSSFVKDLVMYRLYSLKHNLTIVVSSITSLRTSSAKDN